MVSNTADVIGGGMTNHGTLTVTNSAFSGNSADDEGGGIYNGGTATVTNSTLTGNSSFQGGGIRSGFGAATLKNTIVANSPSGGDCSGATDGGQNLIEDGSCITDATSLSRDGRRARRIEVPSRRRPSAREAQRSLPFRRLRIEAGAGGVMRPVGPASCAAWGRVEPGKGPVQPRARRGAP